MRDFARHGSLVLLGTLVANALLYLSYALIQRELGVENAGLFMALLATTQLLSIPSTVMGTVVAKMAADAAAQNRLGIVRRLSRLTSQLVVPVAIIAIVFAWLGNHGLRAYFHTNDASAIVFAAAAFALFFPLTPQRAVFQGSGLFRTYAISGIIEAAGKALTPALLFLSGAGVGTVFAGFAAATAFAYVYDAVSGKRISDQSERVEFPPDAVSRHLIGVVMPITGLTAVTFADAIIVRHYLPAHDSGLYAVAALVGRAIVTITQFVPTVLMPKATAAVALGKPPAPLLGAAAAATAIVVLPLLALVALFPQFIALAVGGRAFQLAAPLMLPYAIAMTALAMATVLATYLIGIGRRKFAIPLSVVCALEVTAITIVHPDIATVVRIVMAGHLTAFGCVFVATLSSLRTRQAMSPAALAQAARASFKVE